MWWRRVNNADKAKEEQGKEDVSPKIQYKSLAPKKDYYYYLMPKKSGGIF